MEEFVAETEIVATVGLYLCGLARMTSDQRQKHVSIKSFIIGTSIYNEQWNRRS